MKTIKKITTIQALEKGAGCYDFTRHEHNGTYVPDRDTEVTVWSDADGNSFIDVAAHTARFTDFQGDTEDRHLQAYTESID